jgi:hypothetical protein
VVCAGKANEAILTEERAKFAKEEGKKMRIKAAKKSAGKKK